MPLPLLDNLAAHRWRHRVVVVFAAPSDPRAERQAALLRGAEAEERHLIVVRGTERLRRALRVPGGAFRVALVGKDGTVKRTAAAPFAKAPLFALIDQMPMRRAERGG